MSDTTRGEAMKSEGARKAPTKAGQANFRAIKKAQNSTKSMLRNIPFQRVVRKAARGASKEKMRIQHSVFAALQSMVEMETVKLLRKANKVAEHKKGRISVRGDDVELVLELTQGGREA